MNISLKKNFKNKKIVITGHTGFKGSWLSLWLLNAGAKVYGISNNYKIKETNFKNFKMSQSIKNYNIDIRDFKKFSKVIKKIKPDYIFHLAAQSLVGNSYLNPLYNFETNFNGTLNLLEIIRNIQFRCIVVLITSDKSYRNLEIKRGYVESDRLGGDDPYSASKGAVEFVINSYFQSFLKNKSNIRLGVCRAGNVVGGGDWSKDRLIPDVMKSFLKKEKVKIRNYKSTRPWQHVLDVINGYLNFAVKLSSDINLNGEVFNFGPPKSSNYSVFKVLEEIKIHLKKLNWELRKSNYKESTLLKLNSKKALDKLGWKNKLNFKEVFLLVSQWYKHYYYKDNIYHFSLKQIDYFNSKK